MDVDDGFERIMYSHYGFNVFVQSADAKIGWAVVNDGNECIMCLCNGVQAATNRAIEWGRLRDGPHQVARLPGG